LYEGFGMPALEALACGAPLVVSNRGSLTEIAGDAGIVVDALDVSSISEGIRRALDPEQGRELGDRGLRRASQFDWAAASRVTRQALEQAFRPSVGAPLPSPTRSPAS
jgi:glycosyltransferase involved in cell wall biosynthesis